MVTKWNSSRAFKPLIKERKAARLLDPTNYAVLHAADFWHRYEMDIPAGAGRGKNRPRRPVRVYRHCARYRSRHVAGLVQRSRMPALENPTWSCISKPVRYLRDADRCFTRNQILRIAARTSQDWTIRFESYLRFAPDVLAEYDRLQNHFGFVIVDAEQPVYDQHRFFRDAYFKYAIRKLPEFAITPTA